MAQIECCFHGKSSGIDPLVSYTRLPVFIKNKSEIELLAKFNTNTQKGRGAIFLIDTKIARATPPLIHHYMNLSVDNNFRQVYITPMLAAVKNAIEALLDNNTVLLLDEVKHISSLQLRYMTHFIPNEFITVWELGLLNSLYSLKLCGAGGGGFILGFTENWEQTKLALEQYTYHKLCSL